MTETNDCEALLEPLRVALKLEQEGRKFFRSVAGSVEGRLAKQTFEFLAAEEDKHIERIKEFYASIESCGESVEIRLDEHGAERRMEAFTDRLAVLREELAPSASDIEAYQLALKFENGAEEFYEKQLEESDDPFVQRFYRWLIREESMHSKVLSSCLEFAKDPAAWFRKHRP